MQKIEGARGGSSNNIGPSAMSDPWSSPRTWRGCRTNNTCISQILDIFIKYTSEYDFP